MGMFRKQQGQTGTITDYSFDIKEWESKKKGVGTYSTLSYNFKFKVDGADEPVERFLNAGFVYEGTTISDDGRTLENDDVDGGIIQEDTEFARFVGSLIEKGFDESQLDESGRNFEALIGQRLQLVNWTDDEATKKFGKRKSKKDGKEYNRTETRVAQVYEKEEVKATKGKAAKSTSKPTSKTPKQEEVEEVDTAQADEVITELVSDAKGNVIPRTGISAQVVRYALKKRLSTDVRDQLRATLMDVEYLKDAADRGIISFNPKGKGEPIGLPE